MNLRRIFKPIAALLLSVGLVTVGIAAPADAGTRPPPPKHDTGWGFK